MLLGRIGTKLKLLALAASVLSAGCSNDSTRPSFSISFHDWMSPELRWSVEVWMLQQIREAAPNAAVSFTSPGGKPTSGSVFTVTSRLVSEVQDSGLAKLLESGVSIRAGAVRDLNIMYGSTAEGAATCLLLFDSPSIRLTSSARKKQQAFSDSGEAVLKFPAWLQPSSAAYRYVYPKFEHVSVVLVQFGPGWKALPEPVKSKLAASCNPHAANHIFTETGMNIIPANREVLE